VFIGNEVMPVTEVDNPNLFFIITFDLVSSLFFVFVHPLVFLFCTQIT